MRGYEPVRASTDYQYRGASATLIENKHLRLIVLDGKGADLVEFRDKRTDIDVLWETSHNWVPPDQPYDAVDSDGAWFAHYPGGWQMNLPLAGWGGEVSGTEYGLHGESALVPWTADIVEYTDETVTVRFATDLVRYPFHVEREIRLAGDEPVVHFEDSITNEGAVPLEYIWQQHIALGPPLVGPDARLDVPAETGYVEPTVDENPAFNRSTLCAGEQFEWPHAPAANGKTVDLREFPPYEARRHDQVYATDLDDGWYAVSNPELDLGFALSFPTDPYECLWYWQPFGGVDDSPFFGRNYNVGLEPTTAHPAGSIPDAQRSNGTMKILEPGETVSATVVASTYTGIESVIDASETGAVRSRDG